MTIVANLTEAGSAARSAVGRDLAYILSPSYSGSTLLTMLVAAHPDVATIGELKAQAMGDVAQYVCSCGEEIRACHFWSAVTAKLRARGHDFDLADFGTHFRAPGSWLANRLLRASYRGPAFETARNVGLRAVARCRKTVKRVLERNRVMIETILDLQGGRVFLDASKDAIRLKHLLDAGLWNIKVIYLLRDGRGATNSYMRHYNVPMAKAAREWMRSHREAERLLARLPRTDWLKLHYEDLCRETPKTMDAAFHFIGCDPALSDLDFGAHEHHVLGNSMRLKPLDTIRLDEKWRRQLTPADLRVFEQVAGKVNAELGYE